jgi:hypothetical protein
MLPKNGRCCIDTKTNHDASDMIELKGLGQSLRLKKTYIHPEYKCAPVVSQHDSVHTFLYKTSQDF